MSGIVSVGLVKKTRIIGLFAVVLFVVAMAAVGFLVVSSRSAILPYEQYIVRDINELPEREIAIVFGGGMEEDGSQSKNQLDRVKTGIELYKQGKVQKLMMTGDDGGVRFDEISAMVDYARRHGVPAYAIMTDPHGYRTYESCYRETYVYGLSQAIVISQDFHLSRILYFCRRMGMDAIGFSADYQGYEHTKKMMFRETGARVKGWIQMEYTKPTVRTTEP